jgi:lysophospholipase L1-like esterase
MKTSTAQRGGFGRKLALSAVVFAALLLAVEGAARVRQRIKYGTFGQVQEFATDPQSGLLIPVPGRDTGAIKINSLGFRGPEIESPKPAGRVRIAFCGASTTYCAEASNNAAVWPARVCAELAPLFPDVTFDYVNAGVPGYTLDQSLIALQQRVAPLEPDVILFYEATNDLTRDTRELAQRQGVYTGHADEDSWLSRMSLAWYLVEKNLVLRNRQEAATKAVGRVSFEPRELSGRFAERLNEFVVLAKNRAKLVALATFAIHARRTQGADEQLRACNTSLYYMPYMTPALLLDGFDEYNRVIRDVARRTHTQLIEVADAIPGDDEHFADSVHFKDAGCNAMAAKVVEALSSSPPFQALCRR